MKSPNNQIHIDKNEIHLVESLFLYASIGIIITNQQGDIIIANPFIEKQFGYTPGELINNKIEVLIPARFHHKHVKDREKYAGHPEGRPMGLGMDLFGRKKDGHEFPVEVSLGHYLSEEQTYIIAFISDISKRKESEQLIKKLNDELEIKVERRTHQLQEAMQELQESKEHLANALLKEKDLNELKSRFVSMASHEFRTPLSTVLSSVYLLEKYTTTEDQGKRKKHIDRIISSVHMLTDILNDFLSVGKIEEGKIMVRMVKFDLVNCIKGLLEEMNSILKKGQRIVHNHEGPTEVVLDISLTKHILMNLISNAIKFSPENSEIYIDTSLRGQRMELSVKDSGIGISNQDQEHLFERFFRAGNASNIQGTGLGLHIVSKYAELMNGTIHCNSILESGTTMTVIFEKMGSETNELE